MKKEEVKEKRIEESKIAFATYKKEKEKIIKNNLKLKGLSKAKFYFQLQNFYYMQ